MQTRKMLYVRGIEKISQIEAIFLHYKEKRAFFVPYSSGVRSRVVVALS